MRKISSALLVYPPTGVYDRFERCQAPVESESVSIMRPPLDLMYLAAILERNGIKVCIRDYPAIGKGWSGLAHDLKEIKPDLFLASVTVHTIHLDCLAFKMAKKANTDAICVLKGFLPDCGRQAFVDCPEIDAVLREEAELTLEELVRARPVEDIQGLSYRSNEGIRVNPDRVALVDLDLLPFPSRHLTDNNLYRMPDNNRKMGMVLLSKGCPRNCIFCLAPLVNNRRVRMRSPDSVIMELEECVCKHGITDFWFRADNFSVNRSWVLEVCEKIKNSRLPLRWATNSRVDSLDAEVVSVMKGAGCFAVGLGIESGSEETLKKIKKGITKEQSVRAVRLCRSSGMQVYLFFVIGFPWEDSWHIKETISFARQLEGDVINFSFAVPFPGTELFDISVKAGVLSPGKDYSGGNYGVPLTGTLYLSRDELVKMEKSAYRSIIFNPAYILRNLGRIRSFRQGICYLRAGAHLTKLCT